MVFRFSAPLSARPDTLTLVTRMRMWRMVNPQTKQVQLTINITLQVNRRIKEKKKLNRTELN